MQKFTMIVVQMTILAAMSLCAFTVGIIAYRFLEWVLTTPIPVRF